MKKTTIPLLPTLIFVLLASGGIARATYSGTMISATVPSQIAPGDSLNVTVQVKNTGTSPWLGGDGPSCTIDMKDFSWTGAWLPNLNRYYAEPVLAGQTVSFVVSFPSFNLPQASGPYSMKVYASHTTGSGFSSLLMSGAPKTVQFRITNTPPSITEQPLHRTLPAGEDTFLSVTARGSAPLYYQWRRNGVKLPGATYSTLGLNGITLAQAGTYSVVVSNSVGSVTSSNAIVQVTCGYNLSTASATFPFQGGPGSVAVSTGCPWTISNTTPWITVIGSTNRHGSGSVSYTVATNNARVSRTGRLAIAGKTFTVTQGPVLSPLHLRGKSLSMKVDTGYGSLAESGTYLIVLPGGTNNTLSIVPLAGPTTATNVPYTFQGIDGDTVSLSFAGVVINLNFVNPVHGSFHASRAQDLSDQYGSFVMANSSPDVNADSRLDIIWQNASLRGLSAWLMSGTNWIRSTPIHFGMSPPYRWNAVGSADFNNDGHADILFHAPNTSLNAWLLKRTNIIGNVALRFGTGTGTNQSVITAADFNGDSQPDVLLQSESGAMSLWTFSQWTYLNTIQIRGGQSPGVGWKAVAAADFNRDAQTDILFQHSSGALTLWLMNRVNFINSVGFLGAPAIDSTWRVQGAADFDSDGDPDILWRNNTGQMKIWRMRNRTYLGTITLPSDFTGTGLNCISPN